MYCKNLLLVVTAISIFESTNKYINLEH